MKKPAILVAVPFETDTLSKVEYLQHKGDPAPSVFKKGDVITVDQWWKENETTEKYWKQWWQPIKLYLTESECLKWDARKEDVSKRKDRTVYYPEKNEVLKWFSVGKEAWEKCRNIIAYPSEIIIHISNFKYIFSNEGKCTVEWEENQCDGCKARIPILEGTSNHKKPTDRTDPFGISCTASRYDRPKLTDGKVNIYL